MALEYLGDRKPLGEPIREAGAARIGPGYDRIPLNVGALLK
jgi:hypothetical protein